MAHILLIEPDRPLAGSYCQALETAGHQVVLCAGAQSAIFATDSRIPDVIVLELQLIEHSGIEFLYQWWCLVIFRRLSSPVARNY